MRVKAFCREFARAFIPMWVVLLLYILFMPTTGNPSFSSLALHQQVIATTALPAMLWSIWRLDTPDGLGQVQSVE
jgi:hypothetical protein